MNLRKEKFRNKCMQLLDYEEKTLNEVKERVTNLKPSLDGLGLEIHISLEWNYFGEENFFQQRIPFKENYCCLISSIFIKKGQDPFNEDLSNLSRVILITDIRKNLLNFTLFEKYSVKDEFYQKIFDEYQKILEIGYDKYLTENEGKGICF